MIMSLKQREITFKPRIKLNHNIYTQGGTPPPPEMTCGFLIQLVFCKKKTMCFIGVEAEQETSAPPPPKKNPGSAPDTVIRTL